MARKGGEHLILFPFMAQGHIIPFMALATILEERTVYTITFVSTPLNVQAARTALPPTTAIQFAELPFHPPDHGLPPDSENTDTLSYSHIFTLLEASRSLQPAFEQLISAITVRDGLPPLCIISDFFFGWTVDVAKERGIFHSVFVSNGAYGTAVYFSLWLNLPHRKTDSDEFLLPGFPGHVRLHRSQLSVHLSDADGTDPWSLFLRPQVSSCLRSDGWLLNTVAELEEIGLRSLSEMMGGRPVWAIGPVSSMLKSEVPSRKPAGIEVDACIDWLNQHPPASVLYISFGSMNTISTPQMMELAVGLEETRRPFIWVVRPPVGADINGEFQARWLPEGFEERITETNQGLLVRGWAPQLEILSHKSTGAFLSHCGWNSILETLGRGRPIIGWPLSAEQFYNSKMLQEVMGVCVELTRTNRSVIHHRDVAAAIDMVLGETEKGEEMRRKARRAKEILGAAVRDDQGLMGSSVRALDNFIETALSGKQINEW